MLTLNLEPVKKPTDVFTQMSCCTNTEIINKKNSLLMLPNNNILKGTLEQTWFKHGSEAALLSRIYLEELHVNIPFQYTEYWLKVTFQIEQERCLIVTSFEKPYSEITPYTNQLGLDLIDCSIKTWKPIPNQFCNIIIIHISEKFLQESLSFIPDLSKHNWNYLTEKVKGKELQIISIDSAIAFLVKNLIETIGLEEQTDREKTFCKLSEESINLLLEADFASRTVLEKSALKKIILAEKQLTNDFKNPPPTLNELTKSSGLNRQKFQTLFKEYFGKPFYQYYQDARFSYAKDLIANKGYNISEAAYMIGYKNISYFSRHFEKVTNLKLSDLKK
jgi:AraC-like DNA-binding protein